VCGVDFLILPILCCLLCDLVEAKGRSVTFYALLLIATWTGCEYLGMFVGRRLSEDNLLPGFVGAFVGASVGAVGTFLLVRGLPATGTGLAPVERRRPVDAGGWRDPAVAMRFRVSPAHLDRDQIRPAPALGVIRPDDGCPTG
jgi:hypothetical protein